MTRLKPLQDRLLLLLEDALHPRGFTRRQQTFVRRVPVGKHLFHVAFAPYPRHDYFDATADVAVRHDALEALLNANDPYLTEREKRWTASVGGELGNLSTGQQLVWSVDGGTDLPRVTEEVLAAFAAIGEPVLDRLSSLEEVVRLTASDTSPDALFCPIAHRRASVAVAAAFLLDRRSDFLELTARKAQYLRDRRDEFGLARFRALVAELDHRWSPSTGAILD